jgi:hypothetical protein
LHAPKGCSANRKVLKEFVGLNDADIAIHLDFSVVGTVTNDATFFFEMLGFFLQVSNTITLFKKYAL